MKLDKQLNLVIPCDTETGKVYVYVQPIAREIFERYALMMGMVFKKIYAEGGGLQVGAALAKAVLTEIAAMKDREFLLSAAENGAEGLDQFRNGNGPFTKDLKEGLLNELWRFSNVIAPIDGKWQTVPLEDAIRMEVLDDKDVSDVENIIVFFTVLWHLHRKSDRVNVLNTALRMWDAHLESLTLTAFRTSLPMLTRHGTSGETEAPSSIPS